ncbi:MAG: hypothetical protein ABI261_02670 [Ginsengibacter sp.]
MEIRTDEKWWDTLSKKDLLELAFILSKRALVLWDNYNFPEGSEEKLNLIKRLPGDALQEISMGIGKNEFNKDNINKLFTLFVTPILQIRDGNLKLPYVVKSTFQSVFDILRGIMMTKNKSQYLQSFSSSITRSLDAIKISNLMTINEIDLLTRKYLLLSDRK